MYNVKFGVIYRGIGDPDVGDFAARVEELGYDSVWTGEHIANWRPILTTIPVLAAMAARSRRITIGSSVLLLPLRQPALVAKELATIDLLSCGRLAVGVGIGGENVADFAACGVPVAERCGRTDEALEIIRRLWREPEITHHGKYFTLNEVGIAPLPARPGGPPLYIGGRKEGAMRRAARYADGFMPYLYTPEQYIKGLARVRALAAEVNREPSQIEGLLMQWISVAQSKAEARSIALAAIEREYGQDCTQIVDRYCVLGTPSDCVAQLRDYVPAGVQHFLFALASPHAAIKDQVRVIALKVLPEFR